MGQINPLVYSVHGEDRFCYLKNKQNVNKINRLSNRAGGAGGPCVSPEARFRDKYVDLLCLIINFLFVSPLKPNLELSVLISYSLVTICFCLFSCCFYYLPSKYFGQKSEKQNLGTLSTA